MLFTDASKFSSHALKEALKLAQSDTSLNPAAKPAELGGLYKAMNQRLAGTDPIFQRALRVALTLSPDIDQKQLMKLLTIEVPTGIAEFVALLCKLTGNTEPSLPMLLELQALLDALAKIGYIHLRFFNLEQQLRAYLRHVDKAAFIESIYILIVHAVAQHILDSFHEFKRCAAANLAYNPLPTWSANAVRGLDGFEGQFNSVAVEMRALAEKRAATENARSTGGQRQRQLNGWGHAGLNQAPPAWGAGAPGGGVGAGPPGPAAAGGGPGAYGPAAAGGGPGAFGPAAAGGGLAAYGPAGGLGAAPQAPPQQPVCRDHQRGACHRGAACRYAH
jgi:hypothetical protein